MPKHEDAGVTSQIDSQADPRRSMVVPKRGPATSADTHARPENPTTAASQIVQTLLKHGVERVFGIPGGPISPVVDALLDTPIEHITCQHENMAMYAAGGEGLVRRKPGVVAVTSGPGVLNALTGLAACYHDYMPLVLLVGEVATNNQGRGALQDGSEGGLNISQMVRSICKKAILIEQPERAGDDIAEALRVAIKPPFGPVVVRIPVDIATRAAKCEGTGPKSVSSRERLPAPATVKEIAERLRTAKRPVLLIGGGVCRTQAYDEVRDLAEAAQCAVATDLEAKGAFPESHPLSLGIFGVGGSGRAAKYLGSDVDFVMTLGARLDDTTTANFSPLLHPENGTLVQVDDIALRLARSYRPDIALASDLKHACRSIQQALGTPLRKQPSDIPSKSRIVGFPAASPPYDPIEAIAALQQKLPPDTVFVSDIGNHLLFASQALTLDKPGCFHASLGLGGMGSGIGTAIGFQAAYGTTRQVVCICGDGSYLMSGNEIATCARYGIPVIFLVINDGQLGMVQHGNERVLGRSPDLRTPRIDIVAQSRTMGVRSYSFAVGLNEDLSVPRGPILLDAICDPQRHAANAREATVNFPTSVGESR